MKKFKVGIVGATGMVGQRFLILLSEHPWFDVKVLAASPRSAGKSYREAIEGRWAMNQEIPKFAQDMTVLDASKVCDISSIVDFVFCAVDMPKDKIKELEEEYARNECPVISNNSAHRNTDDVPMIIPEINPFHSKVIEYQRKRLKTKKGFIAVKSNCSLQSYVPAIHPLMGFKVTKILACTYQAISGAGKTFETWPEMVDNIIPYIGGEEEKSEQEPMKIWGDIKDGRIVNAKTPDITSQCLRVPVSDGHTAAVFVSFKEKPSLNEIESCWNNFEPMPQKLGLPSAPDKFLHYFKENDRPQIKTEREIDNAMAISIGRLRKDSQYDIKFVCMSHNTVRGAAGGAILMAELLCKQGYIS